jgi:hypothetical protein
MVKFKLSDSNASRGWRSWRTLCAFAGSSQDRARVKVQPARWCGRVGSIVLLPLDVGPHVGRRHQVHRVAERLQLAQLLEERQDVAALQVTADENPWVW